MLDLVAPMALGLQVIQAVIPSLSPGDFMVALSGTKLPALHAAVAVPLPRHVGMPAVYLLDQFLRSFRRDPNRNGWIALAENGVLSGKEHRLVAGDSLDAGDGHALMKFEYFNPDGCGKIPMQGPASHPFSL